MSKDSVDFLFLFLFFISIASFAGAYHIVKYEGFETAGEINESTSWQMTSASMADAVYRCDAWNFLWCTSYNTSSITHIPLFLEWGSNQLAFSHNLTRYTIRANFVFQNPNNTYAGYAISNPQPSVVIIPFYRLTTPGSTPASFTDSLIRQWWSFEYDATNTSYWAGSNNTPAWHYDQPILESEWHTLQVDAELNQSQVIVNMMLYIDGTLVAQNLTPNSTGAASVFNATAFAISSDYSVGIDDIIILNYSAGEAFVPASAYITPYNEQPIFTSRFVDEAGTPVPNYAAMKTYTAYNITFEGVADAEGNSPLYYAWDCIQPNVPLFEETFQQDAAQLAADYSLSLNYTIEPIYGANWVVFNDSMSSVETFVFQPTAARTTDTRLTFDAMLPYNASLDFFFYDTLGAPYGRMTLARNETDNVTELMFDGSVVDRTDRVQSGEYYTIELVWSRSGAHQYVSIGVFAFGDYGDALPVYISQRFDTSETNFRSLAMYAARLHGVRLSNVRMYDYAAPTGGIAYNSSADMGACYIYDSGQYTAFAYMFDVNRFASPHNALQLDYSLSYLGIDDGMLLNDSQYGAAWSEIFQGSQTLKYIFALGLLVTLTIGIFIVGAQHGSVLAGAAVALFADTMAMFILVLLGILPSWIAVVAFIMMALSLAFLISKVVGGGGGGEG